MRNDTAPLRTGRGSYELRLLMHYGRGCLFAFSLPIALLVYLAVVVSYGLFVGLHLLQALLVAIGPLVLLLPPVVAIGAWWRTKRLHRVFSRLGLGSRRGGFGTVGWSGRYRGRQYWAVWQARGPKLMLFTPVESRTRLVLHRAGILADAVAKALRTGEQEIPVPADLGLEGARCTTHDPRWAAALLDDPEVGLSLAPLLAPSRRGSNVVRAVPDGVETLQLFVPLRFTTEDRLREWMDSLAGVAEAVSRIGLSHQTDRITDVELRYREDPGFASSVAGCLLFTAYPVAVVIVSALLYWAFRG